MGVILNISLMERKGPPCEFIVCFQRKFTMSDNNPRRQEFHQFPALCFQKAVAANSLHASAPPILKLYARALKNGEQKHLQLYCLLIIQQEYTTFALILPFHRFLTTVTKIKGEIQFLTYVGQEDLFQTLEYQSLEAPLGVPSGCLEEGCAFSLS